MDPRALVGDPTRLRSLGWRPTVDFEQLVALMVDFDLAELGSADGGRDGVALPVAGSGAPQPGSER